MANAKKANAKKANAKNSKKLEAARRTLLKTLMLSGGAVATSKLMPEHWTRPTVASVMLPAHAALSTCRTEVSSNPIGGFFENNGAGSLFGTAPPFSGTISDGTFTLTGLDSVLCNGGPGAVSATLAGTAAGTWTGEQFFYCDGTVIGSCNASGNAYYTNSNDLSLTGSVTCTVCSEYSLNFSAVPV